MENLMKNRRLISWVQNAKHFTSGSVQNLKFPNYCMIRKELSQKNTLFHTKTVKTDYNFTRKYATGEGPPKSENKKIPTFIVDFVHGDTVITIGLILFFIIDYKKYKEKGEGFLLKKDY